MRLPEASSLRELPYRTGSSIVLPHFSRARKRSALGVSNRFDIRRFTALCQNASTMTAQRPLEHRSRRPAHPRPTAGGHTHPFAQCKRAAASASAWHPPHEPQIGLVHCRVLASV